MVIVRVEGWRIANPGLHTWPWSEHITRPCLIIASLHTWPWSEQITLLCHIIARLHTWPWLEQITLPCFIIARLHTWPWSEHSTLPCIIIANPGLHTWPWSEHTTLPYLIIATLGLQTQPAIIRKYHSSMPHNCMSRSPDTGFILSQHLPIAPRHHHNQAFISVSHQ